MTTRPRTREREDKMSKMRILGVFAAILALTAVSAASASAATTWWNSKTNTKVEANEASKTKGTISLHHEGGLGNVTLTCSGEFAGTVGAAGKDSITLVEKGTELDLVKCKSNNTLACPSETVVHAVKLSWTTQLLESGGKTFDKFTSGTGTPGYEALCNLGQNIKCEKEEEPEFKENNAAKNAVFEFLASQTTTCSDGGTGFITGSGEVVGFEVR